jgi:hypothetical protein
LKTQTNDLAAAIKFFPHLGQPILNVCGIKMREEVSQCLAHLEEPRLSEYFESFMANYDAYVLSEMSEDTLMQDLLTKNAA